jgi:hypothetical protein
VSTTGRDTFVYTPRNGADVVTEFDVGDDKIDLARTNEPNDALSFATQVGANTVFNFDNGDTLTLQNVTKTSLTADNFFFAPPARATTAIPKALPHLPSVPAFTIHGINGIMRPELHLDPTGHIILDGPAAAFVAEYRLKSLYYGLPENTPVPPVHQFDPVLRPGQVQMGAVPARWREVATAVE